MRGHKEDLSHLRECVNSNRCSVDLFHLGCLIRSALDFLKWGEVIIVTQALVIIIDAQAQFDHAVDATCELCWLIKVETRGEQRSVKEQPDQVLYGLVRLVCRSLLLQLRHD